MSIYNNGRSILDRTEPPAVNVAAEPYSNKPLTPEEVKKRQKKGGSTEGGSPGRPYTPPVKPA